jgi:hypothetical protein
MGRLASLRVVTPPDSLSGERAVKRFGDGSGHRAGRSPTGCPFIDDAGKEAGVAGDPAGLDQALQPDSQLDHLNPPPTRDGRVPKAF